MLETTDYSFHSLVLRNHMLILQRSTNDRKEKSKCKSPSD
jgi:hypothetical protein